MTGASDPLAATAPVHDHAHCAHSAALDAVRAGRPDLTRRLSWALVLTAGFMLAEVAGGIVANSLALLADAGHMLTDAGALGLALAVAWWNTRRTQDGVAVHRRREAWAATVNAVVLLMVCVGIALEAVQRLQVPEPVATGVMLAVAVVGLAVNLAAAAILRPVVRDNLNARGAYLHVLGDLLGSVGTIAAALIIRQTGWLAADAIASLAVCLLVLKASLQRLREAAGVLRTVAGTETHTAP